MKILVIAVCLFISSNAKRLTGPTKGRLNESRKRHNEVPAEDHLPYWDPHQITSQQKELQSTNQLTEGRQYYPSLAGPVLTGGGSNDNIGIAEYPASENEIPHPIPPAAKPPKPPRKRPRPSGCLAERGQFPSSESCSHYIDCWDGSAVSQQCPHGLLFNEEMMYCDYEYNVDCGVRPGLPPKPSLPFQGTRRCPDPNGRYRSATNCSEFFICLSGSPIKFACPEGLVYNEEINVCDFIERVECRGAVTPNPLPSFDNINDWDSFPEVPNLINQPGISDYPEQQEQLPQPVKPIQPILPGQINYPGSYPVIPNRPGQAGYPGSQGLGGYPTLPSQGGYPGLQIQGAPSQVGTSVYPVQGGYPAQNENYGISSVPGVGNYPPGQDGLPDSLNPSIVPAPKPSVKPPRPSKHPHLTRPTQATHAPRPTHGIRPTQSTQSPRPSRPHHRPTTVKPTTTTSQITNSPQQQPSFPPQPQPSFPSQQQPNFPSQQQPSFPSQQQPSFPSQQQPSFPSQQQPSFPSQQQPSFPSQQQPSFPSQQQPNFPSQQQPSFPIQQLPSFPSDSSNPNPPYTPGDDDGFLAPSPYSNFFAARTKPEIIQERQSEIHDEPAKEAEDKKDTGIPKTDVPQEEKVEEEEEDAAETSTIMITNPWDTSHEIPKEIANAPCKDGDVHRIDETCTSVVVCRDNKPQLLNCQTGYIYDKSSDSCKPFNVAKC